MASIAKRTDGQWRARYRSADNREHSKHFTRKVDAQRWLDEVTDSVVTGQYVDPAAGRQTLVKALSLVLQPSTVRVVHRVLAGILKSAVRDRRIASNPCEGTRLPRSERRRVEPMTAEALWRLEAAMPERFRTLVVFAPGTGLRQGEAFGLTVDRIDFLRRAIVVDRQLVSIAGREPYLAPPKTEASVRVVPAPPGGGRRPGGPPGRVPGRSRRAGVYVA